MKPTTRSMLRSVAMRDGRFTPPDTGLPEPRPSKKGDRVHSPYTCGMFETFF